MQEDFKVYIFIFRAGGGAGISTARFAAYLSLLLRVARLTLCSGVSGVQVRFQLEREASGAKVVVAASAAALVVGQQTCHEALATADSLRREVKTLGASHLRLLIQSTV